MSYAERIPVTVPADTAPLKRLVIFLGHYDTRVFFGDHAFLDVGAGSLSYLDRVSGVPLDHVGSLGSIGRFCEMHPTALVLAGGEHDNAQPVNVSLTAFPILGNSQVHCPTKPVRPIRIGSGVVICANAVVRSGSAVGDGAVIGAGAIVTRDVPALSVVGGAPAKALSQREPFVPWWDFAPDYLAANLADIQDLAKRPGGHRWRADRPRFVLQMNNGSFNLAGLLVGDVIRPFNEAPESVRDYLRNAFTPGGEPYWVADCWA